MRKLLVGITVAVLLLLSADTARAVQEQAGNLRLAPKTARRVIDRLGALNHLPGGQWRVHPGDVQHGECLDLDDSGWAAAQRGSEYLGEAVWLGEWLEVPKSLKGYDLTGTGILFLFQAGVAGSGSPTEIVHFNGRRVAMGESHHRLVLLDGAKPSERTLVAVKLLATAGNKRLQSAREQTDFAANRPSPQDLHDEFLSVSLLAPSFSKDVQAGQSTLVKPIEQAVINVVDAGDRQRFDLSHFDMYEREGTSWSVEMAVPQGAAGAVETRLMGQSEGQVLTSGTDHIAIPTQGYEIVPVGVDHPSRNHNSQAGNWPLAAVIANSEGGVGVRVRLNLRQSGLFNYNRVLDEYDLLPVMDIFGI